MTMEFMLQLDDLLSVVRLLSSLPFILNVSSLSLHFQDTCM